MERYTLQVCPTTNIFDNLRDHWLSANPDVYFYEWFISSSIALEITYRNGHYELVFKDKKSAELFVLKWS